MIQDAAKRGEALENKAKVGIKLPKAEVKHEVIVPPHKFKISEPKPLELQDGVIYQKRHTESGHTHTLGRCG